MIFLAIRRDPKGLEQQLRIKEKYKLGAEHDV